MKSENSVAFIVKGYPRLSETFIAQEILALERRGLKVKIISLRHPTDIQTHPVHREISAHIDYLPEYLHHEPLRLITALATLCLKKRFLKTIKIWWKDLVKDPTRSRVRRLGQALVLTHELGCDIRHLHAHFLHTPASVAHYASILTGLSWSVSAHAKDIWTTPDWDIRQKLSDCSWAVTCTQNGLQHLSSMAPKGRVRLVYHGLDMIRFSRPKMPWSERDGLKADDPLVILCVSRAVPKKGLDTLLLALERIPPQIAWRLVHIGTGPMLKPLRQLASDLKLQDRIHWLGAQSQERVLANYRSADIFVLPSIVANDGDRDGLPNVLLEAHSQGLPCISSDLPGISELIDNQVSGLLVPPGDVACLSEALKNLATNPNQRQQIGRRAMLHVEEKFSLEDHICELATLFGLTSKNEAIIPCKLHSTLR